MRKQICFVFLLLSFHVFAKENYVDYHRAIINCERKFLYDADIPAAINEYKRVFKEYKRPFAKDCFIALQLACRTGDKENAKYFFRKAFANGMEWDAASRSKAVVDMLNGDRAFSAEVESYYKLDSATFWRQLNPALRDEVFVMKNRDDSFKMRAQGFAYQDPVRIQRHKEHLAVIDSNTLRIAELTNRYGFLGDRLVGYMSHEVEYHGKEVSVYTEYIYTLIDQLYYHHGCCYFLTAKELEEGLKNGGILPSMYACFYEWAYKDLKENRPEMVLCKPIHPVQEKYYNICPVIRPWDRHKDLDFVNKCREEIGLASLEHYAKKKDYEKATGMVLFFGMFSIN